MEAILVHKQLHEVRLGLMPRPVGLPNTVRAWEQKNQEAHTELQLAVEWDQLVDTTAEITSDIWAKLKHVHQSTGFTTHMGLK